MLSPRNAIRVVLKGLSQNVAHGNHGLSRNFSSRASRPLHRKRIDSKKRTPNVETTATSIAVPHRYEDMDSATLLTLSAMEIHGARVEILKRHIMVVDQCSRMEAVEVSERNDVDGCFDGCCPSTAILADV